MNKDQVQGRAEEAKGAVKQAAGHVTNKPDLEDRGTVQKVAGKVQKTYGDVKEQVTDDIKDAQKRP
ncbi:MAG TPA: CsbD family protein [Steroidobacteraceae bacterium]